MNVFDLDNLCGVMNAQWVQRPISPPVITCVGTDSRASLAGRIFFAIRGETHDGHAYLEAAARAGSPLLIVERPLSNGVIPAKVGVLQVENTRRALGQLAHAYRRTLHGTTVIAVTGSAGKTTTKRLIHGVLSAAMPGCSSPKSFNNDIGVPLSIFQMKPSDKFLILEIGTNAPGEIAQLAAIAEPDIAVITSLGRCHLAGLGSIEGIAHEKASLLTALHDEGVAIVNADAPHLEPHLKRLKTVIRFGAAPNADLRLTDRGRNGERWWLEVNGRQKFSLALPGKHNAINALAAIAVGRRMGLDDETIARGLAGVEPAAMRMTPQHIGPFIVYNDAYNANPESMIAALDTFIELTPDAGRRVVVLGDMLELGAAGPDLHREIGRHLVSVDSQMRIDHAVMIGALSAFAAAEAAKRMGSQRITALASIDAQTPVMIADLLKPGDAVLIKASRGMGLERVVAMIERLTPSEAAA